MPGRDDSRSSYRYAVKRDRKHRVRTRGKYLQEISGRPTGFEPQLCHAMAAPASMGDVGAGWEGFPWLTLALGSGCLETPEEVELSPTSIAEGVRTAVRSWGTWPDNGEAPDALAARFTESLVRDRLGHSGGRMAPAGQPGTPVEEVAARLALATALLTRLFHASRSASAAAMSRWDTDIATFDPAVEGDHPSTRFARTTLVQPAVEQLDAVKRALAPDREPRVANALDKLIDDIRPGLVGGEGNPIVLGVDHLRMLTEVTWHYLTRNRALYPGWSDLLLQLLLTEGEDAIRGAGRPRPLFFDLKTLPGIVRSLLEKPTRTSWQRREESRGSEQVGLFDGVADVLWAQADAARGGRSSSRLPMASAVVTSFDLEVEIALWVRSVELAAPGEVPRPFSVAVPVHVLEAPAAPEAELCWLLGEIQPTSEGTLDDLRSPRWRVIDSNLREDDLRGQPVVIRLSGAPLLRLPVLDELPTEELARLGRELRGIGVQVGENTTLLPAVTIDEYLALRQSEAELFWSSQRGSSGSSGRALPPWLTNSAAENPRFWMAIGVPIADAAIRNRIVSQITVRRIEQTSEAGPVRPGSTLAGSSAPAPPPASQRFDVDGLAINRRIDDDEAILLYWLGLDVVEEECVEFVEDLHHYADHVRLSGRGKRPLKGEPCVLVGGVE